MRITNIRINSKRPSNLQLNSIRTSLLNAITKAGFITQCSIVSSSALKLGMHMCSFRVDTKIHGYNARYNPHMNYKLGYKRTSTPTWDQRVTYNEIVNFILDAHNVSANVKSGDFTIRKGIEKYDENDWSDQKPFWITQNENNGYYVARLEE